MMTALYSGTSGLRSLSTGMSSISNNIANLNTVAFKNSMMLYSENMSSSVYSASSTGAMGVSQLGLGVSVGVNRTMFQQGSFMEGSSPTDLAIAGTGYFGVAKDGMAQYTRAGNFRFTSEGTLVDPNGFSLLGYQVIDGVASNTVTPITLDFSDSGQGYMAPKGTSSLTLVENIGFRTSAHNDPANPFFSLAAAWNSSQNPPLSGSDYGHKSTVPVYDNTGQLQSLDVYYDYVGTFQGKHVYQYVIGADPGASSGDGLFAAGTMTFSANGQMEDMTMFSPPAGGDYTNLSSWSPAAFDETGNPVFTAGFASGAQSISLNFGIDMNGSWRGSYTSAADLTADPAALYTGAGKPLSANASTSYAGSSGTVTMWQDGYAPGYLQSMVIAEDGTMVGQYSNSQSMDLYRIPIYRFTNEEGLRHEGGNRFSATPESGGADIGLPQTENYGSLLQATLEQSNVDLASEFTNLIITQRGFQMNSKVISTADQMLQKALEIKQR